MEEDKNVLVNEDECTCMLHFEQDSNPGKLKLVIEIQNEFHVKSISESTNPIEIKLDRKGSMTSTDVGGILNPIKNSKIYCAYFLLPKAASQDVVVEHDYDHRIIHHKPLHRPIDPR